MSPRRRGRPAVESGARDAILAVARTQFSDLGYERTTLRGVARRAGVDPRLILHYFGSKAGLFQASVTLPVDPSELAADIFGAGLDGIGRRAAERLVGLLEDEESRRGFLALLRAAVGDPEAAESIRGVLTQRVIVPVAARVGGDQAERRAVMLGTLLVGIAIARHVVALEPLATMPRDRLVAAIAPVIEHYLTGDWTREAAEPPPGG